MAGRLCAVGDPEAGSARVGTFRLGALTDEAQASTVTLSRVNYAYDNIGRRVQTNREIFMPDAGSPFTSYTLPSGRGVSLAESALTTPGGLGADLCPSTGLWTASQVIYDASGRTSETINDDAQITRYYYDALGRTVKTVDPQGSTSESWYDVNSNVVETRRTDVPTTATVVAEVFKNTMFYDSLDRLVLQVDNGRQMPTDLKSYVADNIRVAGKAWKTQLAESP